MRTKIRLKSYYRQTEKCCLCVFDLSSPLLRIVSMPDRTTAVDTPSAPLSATKNLTGVKILWWMSKCDKHVQFHLESMLPTCHPAGVLEWHSAKEGFFSSFGHRIRLRVSLPIVRATPSKRLSASIVLCRSTRYIAANGPSPLYVLGTINTQ